MNGRMKQVLFLCLPALVGGILWARAASAVVDMNAGMVGEWQFQEGKGNVVRDTSDNNNNAILKGGPKWVKDGIGTAMKFDGTGDYLDCGSGAKLDITEKVSLESRVNPEKPSLGEPTVVGKDMSSYVTTWSGTAIIFYINAGHIKCVAEIPWHLAIRRNKLGPPGAFFLRLRQAARGNDPRVSYPP